MFEELKAAGLKPIFIDEDTLNIGEAIQRRHETNEEFIVRIMNFGCPTGGLIQGFVMEALANYCQWVNEQVGNSNWPENGFVTFEAWQATAHWLGTELEKKYGQAR